MPARVLRLESAPVVYLASAPLAGLKRVADYDVATKKWVVPAGEYTVELADSAAAVAQNAKVVLKQSTLD